MPAPEPRIRYKTTEPVDFLVIGSGASGGVLARELSTAGFSLVVLEQGVVVGIITETDMLVELNQMLGGDVSGVRVTIRVPDRIGEFAKVFGAISSRSWGIYASGSVPTPKHPGYWDVVVKVRGVPKDDLVAVLEKIEDHEIVDARDC